MTDWLFLVSIGCCWWLLGSALRNVPLVRRPRWTALWLTGALLATLNMAAFR